MELIEKELLKFGIKPQSHIVHFGVCDKQINFPKLLEKYKIGVFYLGIDTSNSILQFVENYKEFPNYAFIQTSMQNFLDSELEFFYEEKPFDCALITGIFDKPIYEEKQYIFISMVLDNCLKLSKQVIFTINTSDYGRLGYSLLYVINNVISNFNKVEIKKIQDNTYIFSITE